MRAIMMLVIAMSFGVTASAIELKVREFRVKYKDGTFNSLSVDIPGVDEKLAQEVWVKRMKSLKGKTKKKKHQTKSEGVLFYELYEYPCIMYSHMEHDAQKVSFAVAVKMGEDYLNSDDHKTSYANLEKYLKEFAKDVLKAQVDRELSAAKKSLGKQEKQQQKLEKQHMKLETNIAGWKADIIKAEAGIVTNDSLQVIQKEKIENQKKKIELIEQKKSKI